MELEEHMSNLYKPSLEEGNEQPQRNCDHNSEEIELMCIDQRDGLREMDDLQLVGAPEDTCIKDDGGAVRQDSDMAGLEVRLAETGTATARVKQKAGRRPPRGGKVKTTPRQRPPGRRNIEEEDVCFICFDGGSLVLCDRKGCPKAYHPACIKREESFFQSKAKWNCGWHICSICEKASYYMCYTCTYSLCKGCIKGSDYYSVRGNKGFCEICMRTILLIENCAPGNQEKVEVDFDDKTSWEYLFKVYWIFLKEKLLLTLDELTGAKNPWKEPAITAPKGKSSCEVYGGDCNKGLSLENFCGDLDANHAKRRKTKQPEFPNQLYSVVMDNSGGDKGMPLIEDTKWATNELLELVALVRYGDTSLMSQIDVQSLLLEYIKINNLHDPCRKSQIVCDSRLLNLFGKERVGHFEMLKLLESHFVIHEHSLAVAVTGVVDAATSQVESGENYDNQLMMGNDRRKTSKKADTRGGQPNPNEYAAIDVHNISLMYLKRCLVENLIDEADKFNDKFVGSIVRIRLPVIDQKQDIYRLVQVVGTSKAAEPYKIGERTTDFVLEIRNLQKKEVVAIDAISNQMFSEDECSRLRQSIKYGFIKYLTVGEIQEKAMSLQALRVNDLLESEILRLNNLRDRATEKGHRKDLRELVEKLQILNSPEERRRRLLEIPEVHADPKMDPSYESEEDAKEIDENEQDNHLKSINPSVGKKEKESSLGSNAHKSSAATLEGKTNMTTTDSVGGDGTTLLPQRVNGSPRNQGKDLFESENNQVGSSIPVTGGWNDDAVQRPETFSEVSSGALSLSNSPGMVQPSIDFETKNMWHYQDPVGRIQGPFSMVQLRKWSTSGCFPPDFRVWRLSQKRDDSVLLSDVLNGRCNKKLLLMDNRCSVPQEVRAASDDGSKTRDCEGFVSMDTTERDCKSVDGNLDSMQNDVSAHSKSNDEDVKSNGGGSKSSSLTTPADVNSNEGKIGSLLQGSDPLKDNHSLPDPPPECNSLPSPMLAEKSRENMLHQVKKKHQITEGQINNGYGYVKQVDGEENSGQSSRHNCRPPAIDNSSNGCDSNSVFVSFAKALEIPDQNQEIDFSDLPRPTPMSNQGELKGQDAGIKQSLPSEAPVKDSGPSWSIASRSVDGGSQSHLDVARGCQEIDPADLPTPTPKSYLGDLKGEDAEIKQPLPSEAPVLDSGLSWSTASSPVGGGPHLFDVSGDCQEIDFSDLPSPTPKPNHGDMKGEDAGIRQPLPSKASVQDSGPSWSTASSPMGGRPHLPDVSGEWGGYSPTPAKPSVEDSDLVRESSLKPTKVVSDHATTPTSGSCQPMHSSPSHPASNAASWQGMVVPEPDDFTTLGDESISDLLAEVEAMESLNRFASTSDLRCGMEFTPENDCFSPIGGLSPTPDAGKSDALSSSSDLQMHSHSSVTDEPLGVSQAEVLDCQKRSGGRSSMSAEVEEDTKPSDDSINKCKVGSKIQPALPPVTSWDISAMDASWRLGSETANNSQRTVCGNLNLGLGGFSDQWTAQAHFNMNMGTSIGNPGIGESHPRYVGDRLSGPGHHGFHGGDSSFDRGSSVWNGQAMYGGSFRLPPEGQRVCKFNESGYCRKGASCSYWHR